jgi:pyrroline-5-carboxylate reductase
MSKTFGFIGCGNMGGSLVKAVSNAGFGSEILLADHFKEKVDALALETGAKASDTKTIAAECRYVFIGVKPQMLKDCFAEIKDILASRKDLIIVSMAAGVKIEDIKKYSGSDTIIRIMPNLPVALGSGIVLASSVGVNDDDKNFFQSAMSKAGIFDWIDEKSIDAACALSGCGPAYVYMFIEALADGAVACGLPRDKAMLYAAGTLIGASEMVLKSGKHPGKLKDDVCSPGGSTIAGVKTLEDSGFRAAAINAVIAAYEKTKALGK